MEIYLDTQPLDAIDVRGGNLEDMLADILSSHIPAGRILTEVLVDGLTYNETVPREAAGLNRKDIARLDLRTASATTVAQVLLNAGPGHLSVLIEAAVKMADEFRLSDEAEANEKFVVFLQTMQDFFAFLGQALEALAIPLAQLEVEGLSAPEKLRLLTSVLSEMGGRQEEGDWILLADLIEYELVPALKDWQLILDKVKKIAH